MNLSIQDFFNANPHGSPTERIAAHIGDVLKGSDYAIDIHGAGPAISMNFVISPHEYATDQQTRTKTIKMAESSGLTLTKFDPHVEVPGAGTRIQAPLGVSRGAVAHGIPGLTIELRNMNYLLEESITVGVKALKNVLKCIGMLDGIPEKIPGEPKLQGWYKSCDALKVKHGGIVRVLKEPGEYIRKGDVIAKLYNVYGEEVEDVVMPVDGFFSTVLGGYGGRYAAIGEGEQVALIWEKISS
jgi:predicted deacylase